MGKPDIKAEIAEVIDHAGSDEYGYNYHDNPLTKDQAAQEILAKVEAMIPKRYKVREGDDRDKIAIGVGRNQVIEELRQALGLTEKGG